MKRFVPFLNQHYAGKWVQQDRSFGIELSYVDLDLVVTALPADASDRDKLLAIYRSQAVETTASLEERSDWNLSKSWNPDSAVTAFIADDAMPEAD